MFSSSQSVAFNLIGESENSTKFDQYLRDYFSPKIHLDKVPNNLGLSEYVKQKQTSNVMDLIRNYYAGLEFKLNSKNSEITRISTFYSVMAKHTSSAVLSELNNLLVSHFSNNTNRKINTIYVPVESQFDIDRKGMQELIFEDESSMLNELQCLEGIPFSNYDFINSILIALLISLSTISLIR